MNTTDKQALTDAVNGSFEVRDHPSPNYADRPLKDRLVERGQWDDGQFTGVRPWGDEGVVYNPR
jgi:hypothetical protein